MSERSPGHYIFEDASAAPELHRLRLLEKVFDSRTQALVQTLGAMSGWRCLEVGAGAGSIAAWLAQRTGAAGQVVAVDTNTRFLRELGPTLEIVEGDLTQLDLPEGSFDFAHARYVLIHNPDPESLLRAMLRTVKPGGALLLEEPDFSAAQALTGPQELKQGFEGIQRALRTTFRNRGMDYAFGRQLPELLRSAGLELRHVEYDCSVQRGGSDLADMMRLSTIALRDKYLDTGHVSVDELSAYEQFTAARDCWATYYATVRVLASLSKS